MKSCCYESPLGKMKISEDDAGICGIIFSEEAADDHTPLLEEAARQLDEYFLGKRQVFDLPLSVKGTEFQVRVWNALCKIPYGHTASYSQIAEMAGNKKACRAVGTANHRNRILIVIPCHRVIAADGSLGGYAFGTERKQKLLDFERERAKLL